MGTTLIVWLLGITIFDITDLCNVRYCFVDFFGMESNGSVQLMTPLSARTYLEAYYDLSDPQNSEIMVPLVKELNKWDVIPVETLRDTWPQGEWEEPQSDVEGKNEVDAPELEKVEINSSSTSKTLRDGAMVTVLRALLDEPNQDTGSLSEVELLTDFLPKLKEMLYQRSSALKPSPHILDLLSRALEEETDVDLSPFIGFSAEDMSLVVSRLQKHGKMLTLCISNRPDLTTKDLQIVLRDAAGLKALYILEDPQISARGMSPLLKECDIYDTDRFRQAIKPEPRRSPSDSDSNDSDKAVPVGQVCEDNSISQLVWVGVSHEQALDKNHRLESGLIDWETLRQEKCRANFDWSGNGLGYIRYPLDMPLSTARTTAGLLCLFQWGSSSHLYDVEQFSKGAALSFALASSIKSDRNPKLGPAGGGDGLGIGPLGAGLYRDREYEPTPASDAPEYLEPGKWAVVLVHEAYNARSQEFLDKCQREEPARADSCSEDDDRNKSKNQGLPFRAIKRLRYALVTPRTEPQFSSRDFIVADIPAYLERTMGKINSKGSDGVLKKLVEVYKSGIAAIHTAEFYGDDDIHDILPKVFPKQKGSSSRSKQE